MKKWLSALSALLGSAPAAPAPKRPGLFKTEAEAIICCEWLEDEWERVGTLKWHVGEPH